MKLRGAFNPKVQIFLAAVMVAVAIWMGAMLITWARDEQWVRLDLHLLAVGFFLGLLVGLPIGMLRLKALREVVPGLHERFYLNQEAVLRHTPAGANAIYVQRAGFALAFVVCFGLSAFTSGRVLLYGTLVFYVLGQYLTGQTLPFIRFWLEFRHQDVPI